jgi:hypothetical protein
VRAIATDLKIRARVFALKRLPIETVAVFQHSQAGLVNELNLLIDERRDQRVRRSQIS